MTPQLTSLSPFQRLADIIAEIHQASYLTLSKSLAKGGVSFSQYCLLGILSTEMPRPTMTEIARRMKHTTAATTGVITRLIKLSFVRRIKDRNDRRRIYVQITPKGLDLLSRVREQRAAFIERSMELLDKSDQAAWVRIYEKLINSGGDSVHRFNIEESKN